MDRVLWLQWANSHGLPSPKDEKGQHGHSLKGRAPGPCLDRLLLLFWAHITLRMVLIYYAKVRFGWLPFTENKGEGVANYIKKEGYLQM